MNLTLKSFFLGEGPGRLEQTDNKITTLQRPGYGFRDETFFALNICALVSNRYELVGPGATGCGAQKGKGPELLVPRE